MTHDSSPRLRRLSGLAALCVMVLGLLTIVSPANARVFFGIGVPLPYYAPGYYPPPVYYPPPPVYYAPPPPVVYTPPQPAAPAYGQSCNAGAYVCPLDRPMAPGSACYCLGNGGGRVGGRVN